MTADELYNREFAHCPRSPEYKAGARRALELRDAGTPGISQNSPYPIGTAAEDAYRAGIDAGYIAWSAWQIDQLDNPA